MGNKCEKCKYWVVDTKKTPTKSTKKQGECKFDGPAMGPNGYGFWPITFDDDGCFKWKPVEPETLNG